MKIIDYPRADIEEAEEEIHEDDEEDIYTDPEDYEQMFEDSKFFPPGHKWPSPKNQQEPEPKSKPKPKKKEAEPLPVDPHTQYWPNYTWAQMLEIKERNPTQYCFHYCEKCNRQSVWKNQFREIHYKYTTCIGCFDRVVMQRKKKIAMMDMKKKKE